MIGFFPRAYPDEALYSICARYSEMVSYPSKSAINVELFGTPFFVVDTQLPSHLGWLAKALPSNSPYTVDALIDRHTLLPFYAPFLPPSKVQKIRKLMSRDNGVSIRILAGITSSKVQPPNWLNFCPICVKEDKERFGECYWHRLHQAPGVKVCPIHLVFLESSKAKTPHRSNLDAYVTAERAVTKCPLRKLDPSQSSYEGILSIARDVAWLLNQRAVVPDIQAVGGLYIEALRNLNFITPTERLRTKKLVDALSKQCPLSLLTAPQADHEASVGKGLSAWVCSFISTLKRRDYHHPLLHLLFIHFIGYTAEKFFCALTTDTFKTTGLDLPFGSGPWPCLNPICMHFRQLVIKEYSIRCRQRNIVIGTFRCLCGFTYVRSGPETSPKDKYRIGRVISYGDEWEGRLRDLWEDSSLSLTGIAKQLRIRRLTVKRRGTVLGLTFPRLEPTGKFVYADPALQMQLDKTSSAFMERLTSYREQLLSALRDHPAATRRQLGGEILHVKVLTWLYENDGEWLREHLPPVQKSPPRGRPRSNWVARDTWLADKVEQVVERLRAIPGRPVQITKGSIRRKIENRNWLLQNKFLGRLPLTSAVLKQHLETRVQFAKRRVAWAAQSYYQEQITPTRTQLLSRAGMTQGIWLEPEVKKAIDITLSNLHYDPSFEAAGAA